MDKQITTSAKESKEFRHIHDSEPEWFYRLRRDGWMYHQKSCPPNRASHLWRYSDPAKFETDSLEMPQGVLPSVTNGNGNYGAGRSGGLLEPFRLSPELKQRGVIFKDLFSAIRINAGHVEKHFASLVGIDFGRFEALNMALWNDGYFLYIPDNVVIDKPIYIRSSEIDANNFSRSLVVIGNNCEVTLVNDCGSDGAGKKSIVNDATELVAGDGSRVKYINLQRHPETTSALVNYRARIGRDSEIYSIFGGFGGSNIKVNAGTELAGRGAHSRMDGIIFATGTQRFDYHTRHHHTAGNTYSDLNFKVILKDRSNSAYTGLIRIEKDAPNCEAYQENRNLLLNPGARAESIPELEILTDEVRCTHGATMGPIDPEMIFYLKSRGFSRRDATRTIVEGFVKSTLDRIPEEISVAIGRMVSDKLGSE